MERVAVIKRMGRPLGDAFDELFAVFGGVNAVIPSGKRIYIKPNAVHFSKHTYTDPAVLDALLSYLRDHGYTELAVMENSTGGNFTRLVFHATGYARVCRRYGAEIVYLDEGATAEVRLRDEDEPTRIPKRLYDDLILGRDDSFYLSLPKLKTHCMTTVTLGVKNQQAFPIHADRIHRHNRDTLHKRLASLYDLIRPDFCIIDGLVAVYNGHFPATALVDESTARMDLLIGGRDTLAVDVVGARILGYSLDEVEHLRICAEWGLGTASLDDIEVVGESLDGFTERYPCELLGRYNPDVLIVEGKEQACIEGCKGNSLCIQEMLYNDFGGRGGWTLVFGKGVDRSELERAVGDILVVGPCATEELKGWLEDRFGDRRLYFVDACNDLMTNSMYQARLSRVKPMDVSPLNPIASAWHLLLARLHGTTARVPPVLG